MEDGLEITGNECINNLYHVAQCHVGLIPTERKIFQA